MTVSDSTRLVPGVKQIKPFKLRIDWICQEAYGDLVDVELHIMDEEPKVIHRAANPPEAAGWARKWLADRGFDFLCDIDGHQRRNDRHVTLHAVARRRD